ncbi:MAG TPA: hypothetical protein DCZ94_19090 [Lentisphaeria bacterium]|nr:MAG: hypothetical protein A2X48_08890 [Lentisphaerae bacterium GWF2_49_21]HBC89051.1 hypothetical protein [Lentisphaeria bacterium]
MIFSRNNRWVPLVSFILLFMGISCAGCFFYYLTAVDFHRQAQDQISSVASMKVKELFDWRQGRLAVALDLSGRNELLAELEKLINEPEPQLKVTLRMELNTVAMANDFSSFSIYDDSFNLRLSSGIAGSPDSIKELKGQMLEAMKKGRPLFSDFHYSNESEQNCFDMIVPIMTKREAGYAKCIGVILFTVDHSKFIMPLVQTWPTPTASAKIMIARFKGEEILVMNELDTTKSASLKYSRPIGGKKDSGLTEETRNEGVFEGFDYRGRKVLRAVRRVPDSPWCIIAQIDTAEIYEPLVVRAWAMGVTSLALILLCWIRLIFWWNQVKTDLYKQMLKNIKEKEDAEASLKRSEDRISKINQCLLNLGNNYSENVNRLTALCGELTGATCALYNNLQEKTLHSVGQWKPPADYKSVDNAEGHLCYDLIRRGSDRDIMFVPNLKKSPYANTDPNVKAYNLRSYVGHIVKCEGRPVGSLCVVFQNEFTPGESDYKLLGVLATAIGNEERSLLYEKALTASIERFTQIADNTGEWIWEIDADGLFTYSNPVVQNIYGYRPEELVEKKYYHDFFAADEKPRLQKEFDEAVAKRLPVIKFNGVNVHKEGRKIFSECTAVPFYNSQGVFMGYRAVEFDVTERRQLDEERLKVQTLKTVEILAKGIAHDFNNLLASILGNISVVKMKLDEDPSTQKILDDAEHACIIARNLTGRLLTFTKEAKTVKRALSITELIKDAVTFALRGTNVVAEFNFASEDIDINADETQMNQLINNLVINAVQAMPLGGKISVSCSIEEVSGNEVPGISFGKYVKMVFKDNGKGIKKEHLGNIFDPYFSTKEKGSGLGLPTSLTIVKNHRGTILVESKEGKGASFFVYIPLSENYPTARFVMEKAPAPKTKLKARILVMDDEQMVQDMLRRLLEYFGCETVTSSHGREALDFYKKAMDAGKPFNLVIMDLTIPGGMGGEETVMELLKLDPDAKAIASSGYSVDLPDFKEIGFKAIVNKPYTIGELDRVMKEVLGA